MKRILWIASRFPYPLLSGDVIYTTGLLKGLQKLDAKVTLLTNANGVKKSDIEAFKDSFPEISLKLVKQPRRRRFLSVFSKMPSDAFSLGNQSMFVEFNRLIEKHWDAVFIDHLAACFDPNQLKLLSKSCVISYVAHNVEAKIRPEIANATSWFLPQKYFLIFDAFKYAKLEKQLVNIAQNIICISNSDKMFFEKLGVNIFHVPALYFKEPNIGLNIKQRPKKALLLGSYQWIAKWRNLLQFLDSAKNYNAGSELPEIDVVGSLRKKLPIMSNEVAKKVNIHGRVDDVMIFLQNARIGIVAEDLGGGFKLKLLDYGLNGVPIFCLKNAISDASLIHGTHVHICNNMNELIQDISRNIDNDDYLEKLQQNAFEYFSKKHNEFTVVSELQNLLRDKKNLIK